MSRPKITLLTIIEANLDVSYPRLSPHITYPLYERYIFLVVACTDVRFKIVSSRRAAGPRIELVMAYKDSQQQSDVTNIPYSDGDPHDTAKLPTADESSRQSAEGKQLYKWSVKIQRCNFSICYSFGRILSKKSGIKNTIIIWMETNVNIKRCMVTTEAGLRNY